MVALAFWVPGWFRSFRVLRAINIDEFEGNTARVTPLVVCLSANSGVHKERVLPKMDRVWAVGMRRFLGLLL